MWTRLVCVALLTVCLATFIHTDSVSDQISEDDDVTEDDFQVNPTTDDYDDYGGLVKLPTKVSGAPKIDSIIHPETELVSDPNLEADIEGKDNTTTASISEFTKGLKDERNPKIDDSCGDPPSAIHSKISKGRKHRYTEGDVVHYSCDFGYVTEAFEWTSKCILSEETNTLEWTPPQIICIPRSCGDPGFVDNGHRIGSLFTFPNKVTFECDEGYVLNGNGIRYCKTSGTWSGTLPTCEKILCNRPLNPENGKVTFDSLEFGSELLYECENGFVLRNLQPRFCSENGTWSGDNPNCQEAQCEPPVAPEHGTVQVVGGKSNVGSRAIYTCDGGRFLVGSVTSTCLDIGQWTFPTPKCREPCAVPKVPHGQIGKYERYYRRMRYTELSEGTKIEDGSELSLKCDSKYEPFGTLNIEEKIYCRQGEWDRYPRCEPAICRAAPPQTPNASVRERVFSKSHGAGVVYDCNTYFIKSKFGNVSCQFGTWKGNTPTCKDTRCDVNSLASFSIKKTTKRYYKSQEAVTPQCETGYTALRPNIRIMCLNGDWKGLSPLPCTPGNCSDDPPEIENGHILNFAIHHTSDVTYACNDFFTLKVSDSKVQCKFGKWTGTKPTCQDTRCYAENLPNGELISADTERTTSNDATLQVQCTEGFSFTGIKPKCINGEWEKHQTLCKESDCNVYNINHGRFTEKFPKKSCNIFGRNCDHWDEYYEVGRNRNFPAGSSLIVTCDKSYIPHGKGKNNVDTKCTRGKWRPHPVCLKPGESYYETSSTKNSHVVAAKGASITPTTKVMSRTTRQPEATRPPKPAEDTHRVVGGRNATCSCTFLNSDPYLAAFSGTEKLQPGTLIKDGCKVKFHCSPVGYYRLNGPREIVCKDCRTWHSSEYPQCEQPKLGDTYFRFEGYFIELSGGTIGAIPGSTIKVTCIPVALTIYPQWITFPRSPKNIYYDHELYNEDNGYTYKIQVLELSNLSPEQNGMYECAARGYRSNSITIQVINPPALEISCPLFNENDYFIVYYDKGQSLNSSAMFSCKDPKQKVFGPSVVTCLSSGQWSGDPPQCMNICPELKETDGMVITYNDNRKTDSRAIFNCVLPRILTGVSTTVCKLNGEWADALPTCEMPSCKLEDLYSALPEYVVPDVVDLEGDKFPYDFSLSLTCDGNYRLVGTSDKAKCKHEGQWEIEKVQCVIGCAPVDKLPDSEILIDPEEEFYRIGQFVTFSCVPGQRLSTEVERIMCLPAGWSQKVMPTCVNSPTDDYVDDEGTRQTEKEASSSAAEM